MVASKLTRLVAYYEQQHERYLTMLALAKEQLNCLQAGNYPVFLEIMERRQRLVAEVDGMAQAAQQICADISSELGLSELNLSNLRGKLSEQMLAPLAAMLAKTTETLQELQQIDSDCEAQIRQTMQSLRGEMSNVQRGQVAMRAYKNNPTNQDARFIDKQK